MKDYLLLFRGGLNFATATPQQIQEAQAKWKIWMEELRKKGIMTAAERLDRNTGAFIDSKKQVTDGPYTEAKEVVGGFISIKAADIAAAIAIGKECPIFNYGGSVEVRDVLPIS